MLRKLLFLALFIWSLPSQAKLRIVATTQDLAYFARVIGGEEVEVTAILKGHQDPHFALAKPSYMVAISRADLLLLVGLDLEIGWLPTVLQGARNPSILPGNPGYLDCSQFIAPIEVPPSGADRSKGDLHPRGNPHYWLDPERAKAVASGIAARMSQLNPSAASVYEKGLRKLLDEIESAEKEARLVLQAPLPPIVTYHVTFSYFFERFGLAAVAYIEAKPGIPPSPSHIAYLKNVLGALPSPPVFLIEPYYDLGVPKQLASSTGGRIAVVPTSVGGTEEASTYKAVLLAIARAIGGR